MPKTDPSPFLDPPRFGALVIILFANLENGKLCKYTVPVPFRVAKKKPSPEIAKEKKSRKQITPHSKYIAHRKTRESDVQLLAIF